jgi:DNA-binding transcriptional LysR family regulator
VSEPFVVAFTVGVTPGKWARIWGERMPTRPLELRSMSTADCLAAVTQSECDMALVRLPVADDRLSAIPLYEELGVVVVPLDHPISAFESVVLADLEGENVLPVEAGNDIEQRWSDAIELVAANVGVVIVPQSVARAHSRRDVVARAVTDAPSTRIALVWLAERTTEPIEEFVGIVRGRTANSSRGVRAATAPEPAPKSKQRPSPPRPTKPGIRKQRFPRRPR